MIDSFAVFKRSYWKLIKQLDTTTISTATTTDRHYLEKKMYSLVYNLLLGYYQTVTTTHFYMIMF